jgi:CheY-like chemotaxis protein
MSKNNIPRILIVDDDVDAVEIIKNILKPLLVECCVCYDSDDALNQIKRNQPDLIITDLMMSSLDSGFSLAKTIRNHPDFAAIPIILCTSIASREHYDFRPKSEKDLADMNINAFFEKPIDPDEFLQKVQELLHQ